MGNDGLNVMGNVTEKYFEMVDKKTQPDGRWVVKYMILYGKIDHECLVLDVEFMRSWFNAID